MAAESAGLIEYPHVEQRSDEWHDQRRGLVTASAVGRLITPGLKVANNDHARGLAALLVAERITGRTEPTFVSAEMWRGIEDEPVARQKYAEHYAPVETCGFMVREMAPGYLLGFSPDGLVGDDGVIEIKSRSPKRQLLTVLADEVPAENMAQIQCGLLVSGRDWCDYVSFSGGMALWRKRVQPDVEWFKAITEALYAFEASAERMVRAYRMRTAGLPQTEHVNYGEIVV